MSKNTLSFGSDRVIQLFSIAAGLVASSLTLFIFFYLIREAAPFFSTSSQVISDKDWFPTEEKFGMGAMVFASFAISLGALVMAVPLGVSAGLYAHFYAPSSIKKLYSSTIELLASVPSVVFGLWGLTFVVPVVAKLGGPGTSMLSAAIVLSLMILPLIALTAHSAVAELPRELTIGAEALGLSRASFITELALPQMASPLATGVLLAFGRALGETMVVLMVSGNVAQVPSSVLEPVRTLTANIALEMSYAIDGHRNALFMSGLILVTCSLAIITLSIGLRRRHA